MGLEELEAAWNAKADRFNQWSELGLDEIVAFAQEVEREMCAQICENEYPHSGYHPTLRKAARQCAAAIRVRSNVEFSGDAPLHGAASAGTEGYASEDNQ